MLMRGHTSINSNSFGEMRFVSRLLSSVLPLNGIIVRTVINPLRFMSEPLIIRFLFVIAILMLLKYKEFHKKKTMNELLGRTVCAL